VLIVNIYDFCVLSLLGLICNQYYISYFVVFVLNSTLGA